LFSAVFYAENADYDYHLNLIVGGNECASLTEVDLTCEENTFENNANKANPISVSET